MIIADRVGERLREERERLGLTQTEFGVLLDLRYVAALEEHGVDAAFVLTGRRSTALGVRFTPAEEELINQFRSIAPGDQDAIRRFLKAMADDVVRQNN